MKKVKNLADLGKLAGVSAASVSRALKDSPEISTKTKEKIRALALEHNFILNASARNLRLQKTNTVAVIINAAEKASGEVSEQTHTLNFLGKLCDELSHRGLDMMVSSERSISQCWHQYFLQSQRADGIIVLGQSYDPEIFTRLASLNTPFVVYGAYTGNENYALVGCDSQKSGAVATSHLINDAGRHNLLYLGPIDNFEAKQRIKGFVAAHKQNAIPFSNNKIKECGLSAGSAYACLENIILKEKQSFDGVFACSDEIAIGAMQCMQKNGIEVSKDVSIVGFDDILAASYMIPTLSSINQQPDKVAMHLVDSLEKLISGEKVSSIEVNAKLMVRDSSINT